ncbi:MAG: intradiol ring-cleavage dioxygenase [Anaerolineae bacterium]|nr:intradiol ring-cleavage dioxygenase [Anaerolineae bacterium]
MHDDDKPIGRVLSRREMLMLLGGASAAVIAGAGLSNVGMKLLAATPSPTAAATGTALPTCVVKPALTEGPYFVDEMLNRSDIRIEPSDNSVKEGALFHLIFNVSDVSSNACKPLEGAQVDIWHCDADGHYSDVTDASFNTKGQKWLRGYQVTDKDGKAEFVTIYPGWYSGRTVHIHFKIRTDPASDAGYEFTSQLFFDEAVTAKVYAQAPYASKGTQDTLNANDGIFQGSEGMLTLVPTQNDDGSYAATFGIGLDLSQPSPTEASGGGPGGNPPGGNPPRR